ncbi:HGGxSTG domain-containing protein [Sphingomonas arenae]|uniref:HGGxSTG domain-containing protein n=1 Tax=Sphingomonas arenae TaxID=2812555 RepID=UPI003AF89683
MQPDALPLAGRCQARTRKGTPCQSLTVSGKERCRMHGGTNPGAPRGNRNAWKHGGRSSEARRAAAYFRYIVRSLDDGN